LKSIHLSLVVATMLLVIFYAKSLLAHGDVTPQPVNTDSLKPLGDEWLEANPYSGDEKAISVGSSAYNSNCARCHGLEAVSGGMTPDLRKLNDLSDWDSADEATQWYIDRVRKGAVVNGRYLMPPFEQILNQEAIWAIKAYLETREPEEE